MATISVRLAGTGGQGLILAGLILAEAAAKYHGKNVVQTNSYGPEARGGASKSDVKISDEPIYNPKPAIVDYLLVLSQPAYDKYRDDLSDGGVVIYDSGAVRPREGESGFSGEITRMAKDDIGAAIVTNVVALGMLTGVTGIVSDEAVEKAVLARVPAKARDLNAAALRKGIEEGRRIKEGTA